MSLKERCDGTEDNDLTDQIKKGIACLEGSTEEDTEMFVREANKLTDGAVLGRVKTAWEATW